MWLLKSCNDAHRGDNDCNKHYQTQNNSTTHPFTCLLLCLLGRLEMSDATAKKNKMGEERGKMVSKKVNE